MKPVCLIFSMLVVLGWLPSETLGGSPAGDEIKDLYHHILIGELFPSGKIYLERFSLHGGGDNQQHFEDFDFSEEIRIYPLQEATWTSARASFRRLMKAISIGRTEKHSRYFQYPFSGARQDALLYTVEDSRTNAPATVFSIDPYRIEEIIYFGDADTRVYSKMEYEAAMNRIREDHRRKDEYGTVLSKITRANTILNAKKLVLFRIRNLDYDALLSVYMTHGIEYASTVYVIDFIKDGNVVLTKEKYNTDGPY